jgi:hypothetical protein
VATLLPPIEEPSGTREELGSRRANATVASALRANRVFSRKTSLNAE